MSEREESSVAARQHVPPHMCKLPEIQLPKVQSGELILGTTQYKCADCGRVWAIYIGWMLI